MTYLLKSTGRDGKSCLKCQCTSPACGTLEKDAGWRAAIVLSTLKQGAEVLAFSECLSRCLAPSLKSCRWGLRHEEVQDVLTE